MPIAAHAETHDGTLHLRALVARPDGTQSIRAQQGGSTSTRTRSGPAVAENLLQQGAREI